MRKRSLLALVLVGAMSLGCLAGCGASESSKGSTDSAKESVTESKSEQKEESKEEPKEEPVEVIWYLRGTEPEEHDMVMESLNEDLVEKINVKLDLRWIEDGEFDDRMKLIITSGEDYDLCYTASWTNNFTENVSREAFLDVTDLLDEYGQDIKAQLPEWVFDVAKVNGGLYAIPNYQTATEQYGISIQKEFLDKYDFDLGTVDEYTDLEPFLEQIRDNEPDYYPMDHSQRDFVTRLNYESVGTGQVYVKKGTEEIELVSSSEAGEEQMLLFLDWYKKGFYRQDLLTMSDDTADRKANKYVVKIITYKPGVAAEESKKWGVDYEVQPMGVPYVSASSGIAAMTAINVNSKNPEAAMKLLNLMHADEEVFNKVLFGIEGVHYNKVGDNRVELIEGSKYYRGGYAWMMANQFNAWLYTGQADDVWEQTEKMNNESQVSPLRGFSFDPEPVQAELAQLSSVNSEYANMELVAEDLDAFLKEKYEKLDAAGRQTVVDETQKQIEAWLEANK